MSKYDYRDPATDPAYCAGLEPRSEDDLCDCCERPLGNATTECPHCHVKFAGVKHDEPPPYEYWSEEYTGDLCIWCQQPVPAEDGHHTSRYHPYCSSLCEHQAEQDSQGDY